jgi:hypothetical protein
VDAEPTSAQLEAQNATNRDQTNVLKRWNEFKKADLPAFNRVLRESQVPEIDIQAELNQLEPAVDEE